VDGIHDLGGKPGYGAVDKSGSEHLSAGKAFAEKWQAKVFAMVNAGRSLGAFSSSDRFRHAIERVNPDAYLAHGYYGRWLGGVENLLVEAGVVSSTEITERAVAMGASASDLVAAQPSADPDPLGQPPAAAGAQRLLARAPAFRVGDTVQTLSDPVEGHTRLPEYARGKVGTIIMHHEGWVYPDTNAHGKGEQPQHLYTVRFSSKVLWGSNGFSVSLDLFEPYLLEVSQ
jgi:nitrile hydratase